MGIRQNVVDWEWQTLELRPIDFLMKNDTTLRAGPDDAVITELSTFGIPAITMSTAGHSVRLLTKLRGFNLSENVYFRFNWTSDSTTAADSTTWKGKYTIIDPDEDAIDPSSPTAMTPASVTDTVGSTTAYKIRRTNAVYVPANSLNESVNVLFEFEMDAKDNPTNVYLLSVEVLYLPRLAEGQTRVAPSQELPSDWTVAS